LFVWSGHNYALEVVRHLGIDENRGVLRIGLVHYNTDEDVDRALASLDKVLSRP
jgi:selenocysteine lyase/cysteine desulfurase